MGLRDVEAALDSGWERALETVRGSFAPDEARLRTLVRRTDHSACLVGLARPALWASVPHPERQQFPYTMQGRAAICRATT